METVEHDTDIRGGHPVLENRRVVEIRGRRASFESAEGDPPDGPQTVASGVPVAVGTPRFLLVRLGNSRSVRPAIDSPALRRVKLKRLPSFPIVHRFVDRSSPVSPLSDRTEDSRRSIRTSSPRIGSE